MTKKKEVASIVRNITAHDVAKKAGVSQSAVSRVFTPGASVGPVMRGKVLEATRALGYRPNLIARSLITGRSRMIGVVVGYLHNQFYPHLLEALSSSLQAKGYQLLLFIAPQDGNADPAFEEIMRYKVDGLILASTTVSSRLAEECNAQGVPVVLLNRTTREEGVESVTGDNVVGGRTIADFLVASGHKRFAYVAGIENSSTNRERERGYRDRLSALGVKTIQRVVGDYDFDKAAMAADMLVTCESYPDAIFCANDHMALAVMDALRHKHKLKIPRDVSVIGFDDVGPARWPSYDLTTFSQPVGSMVDAAVNLLESRLLDPQLPARQVKVRGGLIVRSSARLPPKGLWEMSDEGMWRKRKAVNT